MSPLVIDPHVLAGFIAGAAGITGSVVFRWITGRSFNAEVAEYEKRVAVLEGGVAKLKKAVAEKAKQPPAAGPFRTVPIGDPNAASPLPEPVPPAMSQVVAHDGNLTCPVCNACNRFLKTDKDGFRPVNKSTHTACNGCEIYAPPHLHVECWACKFKYAVKPASESKNDEA